MEAEKTLKEKVFEACNLLQEAGEKITTQKVREYTKGSTRDISRYINKWNEAKSSEANSTITEDDLAQLTLRAAQRSALIMEREEEMVIYYLEHPDRLPPDLLAKVAAAQKKIWEGYSQRSAQRYDPETFFQMMMDYINRRERPS